MKHAEWIVVFAALCLAAAPVSAARKKDKRARVAPKAASKDPVVTPPLPSADAAAPEFEPLPKGRYSVALLPLAAIETDSEVVRALESALLGEVDRLQGMRGVSPGDIAADAKRYAIDLDTCDSVDCLAMAGRAARAHQVLQGRVASIGGTLNMSLRAIDSQTRTETARVADALSHDPTERAAELQAFIVQLLAPQTYVGVLELQLKTVDAEVYIDDALYGRTPLKKKKWTLPAGSHILRITAPGYADIYRFIDVVYQRHTRVAVDLESTTVALSMVQEQPEATPPSDEVVQAAMVTALSSQAPLTDSAALSASAWSRWRPTVAVASMATGGVALGLSLLFAREVVATNDAARDLSDQQALAWTASRRTRMTDEATRINSHGERMEVSQYVALGVGVVLSTVGGVLFFSD